jgi:cytoskeletal protein RodZ
VSEEDRAAFGQFLSSARKDAGRSLEEIAQSTKISSRYLDALERGHVEVLPAGMYRRAMLRNYASAIGLDTRTALERFDRTFGMPAQPESPGAAPPRAPHTRTDVPRPGIARPSATTRLLGSRVLEAATVILVVVVTAHFVGKRTTGTEPVVTPASFEARLSPSDGSSGTPPSEPSEIAQASLTVAPVDVAEDESSAPAEATDVEHRLDIESNPDGARVTVNGVAWGVTPITIRHLPPGEKVIRVTKDGYVGRERRVHLGGETGSASLQLTLAPRD